MIPEVPRADQGGAGAPLRQDAGAGLLGLFDALREQHPVVRADPRSGAGGPR